MKNQIHLVEIILYVNNQEKSTAFYKTILRKEPVLHVPGITEFLLSDTCKLAVMENNSIAEILGDRIEHPAKANGIPRCELYLFVEDVALEFNHAIESGAALISPLQLRPWGDKVCYFADLDGHIIAFAEKQK